MTSNDKLKNKTDTAEETISKLEKKARSGEIIYNRAQIKRQNKNKQTKKQTKKTEQIQRKV